MGYNESMSFLRKAALLLSSVLLKLGLVGLATAFAVVNTLGAPDKLKQSLDQGDAYHQAVSAAMESALTAGEDGDGSLSLARPEIRAAAEATFTPSVLKVWTESFIDSFYGWLEGKTKELEFRIDLTGTKQTFIQRVADQAEARLKSLPPCSVQESLALSRQQLDPFNVQCRPPIDITAEKQRLVAELQQNDSFLKDPAITAAELPAELKDSALPENFQRLKSLPLFLLLFSLIPATVIVFTAASKRAGLKKVFFSLLTTGVFLLVGSLIFAYFFNTTNVPSSLLAKSIQIGNEGLNAALMNVAESLLRAFSSDVIRAGAVYTLLGGGGLLASRFVKPGQKATASKTGRPN